MLALSKGVFNGDSPKENLFFFSWFIGGDRRETSRENDFRHYDGLDIKNLMKTSKPRGTSCYHPKILLKVLIYAYVSNSDSDRNMEQALKRKDSFYVAFRNESF